MRTLVIAAALLASSSAYATQKPTTTPPATPVYSSSADASASSIAAAAAAAFQAQGQKQNQTATGVGYGVGGASQSTAFGGGGGGGGGGGAGGNAQATNGGQRNSQTTVVNANSYQARQRLQAPGIAASFSSVAGNPCERAPLGAGLSLPGLGGLFQIPLESGNCWMERKALLVRQLGGSSAAAIAVLGGHDVITAVNSYGYEVQAPRRAYRVKAKRSRPCVPCSR